MTDPARLPVLIGVGQLRSNVERLPELAREPRDLIVDAARAAVADTGVDLLHQIDDVSVVNVMSWSYDDLPGLVGAGLGITPTRAVESEVGGNRPVELLLEAAARVVRGESRLALVCGGEATSSFVAALRAGTEPDWSREPGGFQVPATLADQPPAMIRYGLHLPVRAYPLYELPLAARLGQTPEQAHRWSAELFAQASEVAAGNEAAWDPRPRTVEQVATVAGKNRMVCHPYPVLMTAQPMVDQAAAFLVTTLATARELGISDVVHVVGGARGSEPRDLLERSTFDAAPALEAVLRATLSQAGLTAPEIEALDLYSCFPVVPKLALLALGLPLDTPTTVTGGLSSFGGPGNAYSLFAVVAVARRLRAGARHGLVYGNGEHITKHCAAVLSGAPHPDGFLGLQEPAVPASAVPASVDSVSGTVRVEAFTVEHERSGEASLGYLVCRDDQDRRLFAHSPDAATLAALEADPAGALGRVLAASPDGQERRTLVRLPD